MEKLETFEPVGRPLTVSYDAGAEDFFHGLVLQQRAQGQGKRYFQMAFALALAFGMFYSWLRDSTYVMGLVLGIICVLLFFALFLLPGFIMKRTAAVMAENMKTLEFRVYENGVTVYDGLITMSLPCEETAVYENDKMYLFETKAQRIYPLPKRILDPMEKKIISQMLSGYPAFYIFSEAGPGKKQPG